MIINNIVEDKMPSTGLGGKWNGVSKTKNFGGESYRVYAKEGLKSHHPIAYSSEPTADRAAKKLREDGWLVRLYEIPSWAHHYVLYMR